MASGCIVGTCPVCNELIWEDEWDITEEGTMLHERCKVKYIAKQMRITEEHLETLSETKKIEIEIEDIKNAMDSDFKYYKSRIEKLENKLNKLGGSPCKK